ncbi:MAG TPA: restriction endonuclease subunit S [Thiobacillaceae bacterium]|nr:restriction endonuclease subunit S [Thiobacillaceae bacterium]
MTKVDSADMRLKTSLDDAKAGRVTRHESVESLMHHLDGIACALGDVVKPTRPRVKPSEKPDLPFIGMEHVEPHSMRLLGTVPASTMKSSAVHFQPGDVLYGRLRPYLNKVYRPDFEGLCSAEFIVFPKTENLDSRYLQYFLNSAAFVSFATHLNAGDRPRVDFDQLAPYPFPVRSLDQQKRIVAEIEKQFSRLDEAVANLKRVKANLKRYKAAVFKAAVEGRLVETEAELARREGRSFETGEQLLQRILETRRSQWQGKGKYKEPVAPDATGLPELPEGWVWASVEQLGHVGTGATPLRSRRDYYDGGEIPWITSGALNEEFVSTADECITELAVEETNAKVFPEHTLLVAMYGEGKTRGKVSELLIEAATNQACAAIVMQGLSKRVRSFTKLFFLKNYEDIRRLSSGGVQPNLNLSHIKATAIPFPPLAEQHRIVAEVDRHLSIIHETKTQVDANLQRAESLRHAILYKSLSSGI